MIAEPMFIQHLKVSGLLSFGPRGIDLPLEPLNVMIGPNGSGKSNLLEVLALLAAAPRNLPGPMKEMGGVEEWFWKGGEARGEIDCIVSNQDGKAPLRHVLEMGRNGERFELRDERIEFVAPTPGENEPYFFYRFQRGRPVLNEHQGSKRGLKRESVRPEESILSQVRDPERYPELAWLQERYEAIRMFRNWSFGPRAAVRRAQLTDLPSDFLLDGGDNLALVLSEFGSDSRRELVKSLQQVYAGIEDFRTPVKSGFVQLLLEEAGGRSIPATRLSDGTLRYLCLLAILLHPDPPPVVAIEEPELGLHPDLIPHVAELLIQASERCQLFVTTHSPALVDALGQQPGSVIVCEKEAGESRFRRLDPEAMKAWLESYSLGELWTSGELEGNRW
jgi:predicted ATPase